MGGSGCILQYTGSGLVLILFRRGRVRVGCFLPSDLFVFRD